MTHTISVDQDIKDVPDQSKLTDFVNNGGTIRIEKNNNDVFKYAKDNGFVVNEKSEEFFHKLKNDLNVKMALVYGVATDYCVKDAVNGLKKIGIKPIVVKDAVKEVADNGINNSKDPTYKAVTVITTDQLEEELNKLYFDYKSV